jgi:hypothetical protein
VVAVLALLSALCYGAGQPAETPLGIFLTEGTKEPAGRLPQFAKAVEILHEQPGRLLTVDALVDWADGTA